MFFLLVLFGVMIAAFVRVAGEKRVAEKARIAELKNLRLYKQETEFSRVLSDSIRATALNLINTEDFLAAPGKIKAISSHLAQETDPANRQVLMEYLALLHFVLQDFHQANTYFDQIEVRQRYSTCHTLAKHYAALKADGDWLDPTNMVDLLDQLKRHLSNVFYYMAYYYFYLGPRNSPEDNLPVVEVVLDELNNLSYAERTRRRLALTETEHGWHLSLAGQPYMLFRMPIPAPLKQTHVLRPLKLSSLDVSHSAFNDLERLHGLLIDELNIAGMRTIDQHKFYIFDRLKVKKVYHTLEYSDRYLQNKVPGVEFVRVAEPGTSDLEAVADTIVNSNKPDGTDNSAFMKVKGRAVDFQGLVKFDVALDGKSLQSATLKLTVYDAAHSVENPAIYACADKVWQEGVVTWNTRPAMGRLLASTSGIFNAVQTLEFDVSSYITGDGTFSFYVWSDGATAGEGRFASKENGTYAGPTLTLVTGCGDNSSP